MMTRLLTNAEFRATFAEPMRDITDVATDVVDIWPYVASVPRSDLFGHRVAPGEKVQNVYRNAADTFDHILVTTTTGDVFLVVVADLRQKAILGHYLLDLKQEYGLATRH